MDGCAAWPGAVGQHVLGVGVRIDDLHAAPRHMACQPLPQRQTRTAVRAGVEHPHLSGIGPHHGGFCPATGCARLGGLEPHTGCDRLHVYCQWRARGGCCNGCQADGNPGKGQGKGASQPPWEDEGGCCISQHTVCCLGAQACASCMGWGGGLHGMDAACNNCAHRPCPALQQLQQEGGRPDINNITRQPMHQTFPAYTDHCRRLSEPADCNPGVALASLGPLC